jgi:antitoxin component YwqK of YwqJK toxin-antitoxin module
MRLFYNKVILTVVFLITISLQGQTEFNKLDSDGRKQGLWKGFFEESKRPRYEGTFEHGKEVGVFKYFDDTKAQSLLASRTFNSTDNSVYTVFYNQQHSVVSEGKSVNKLFEGEWKYYHENSKVIMTLEYYVNGKLEGLRSVYFPSSKIAEETIYKNGVKEGGYKKYSEKGIVLESVTYTKGQYNGLAVYKDPDDNVVAQGLFENGKKVGIWKFYESGKLVNQDDFDKPRKRFKSKKE